MRREDVQRESENGKARRIRKGQLRVLRIPSAVGTVRLRLRLRMPEVWGSVASG